MTCIELYRVGVHDNRRGEHFHVRWWGSDNAPFEAVLKSHRGVSCRSTPLKPVICRSVMRQDVSMVFGECHENLCTTRLVLST